MNVLTWSDLILALFVVMWISCFGWCHCAFENQKMSRQTKLALMKIFTTAAALGGINPFSFLGSPRDEKFRSGFRQSDEELIAKAKAKRERKRRK